jgi:hypothetical protein
MVMQMDVTAAHPVFGSTRMADGDIIADATLRTELVAQLPAVAARCEQRARWMRDAVGMPVPETFMPLADTYGNIAPWLLDAGQIVTLK